MAHRVPSGLMFAMSAGFFAALASIFAKLAFDSHYIQLCICGQDSEAKFFRPLLTSSIESKAAFPMDTFKCENVRNALLWLH